MNFVTPFREIVLFWGQIADLCQNIRTFVGRNSHERTPQTERRLLVLRY
jgi:hypothetical protein